MSGRGILATLGLALAALASAAAPAAAESGRLADYTFQLTSTSPGSASGLAVQVVFHRADDPDAKPSPLRSAVIKSPPGMRFDSSAAPECTASDDALRLLGPDACPDDTALAVGNFKAITGFGPPVDPLSGENHVFNGPHQLIEVITAPGLPLSPAFDRLTYDGSAFTAHPPKAPGGPPDGESAVKAIGFYIPARGSLFTTPPGCLAGGRWTSTATFGFADGTTDTVASSTPCDPPKRPARTSRRRCRHSHRATSARARRACRRPARRTTSR